MTDHVGDVMFLGMSMQISMRFVHQLMLYPCTPLLNDSFIEEMTH